MLEYLDQWNPLIRLLFQELVDEVFIFLRYLRFEVDLRPSLIACDGLLVASKRSISMDKLVQENAECPHVKLMVVVSVVYHLRCHIL